MLDKFSELPAIYAQSQKLPALASRLKNLHEVLIPNKLFIRCSIKMLIVTDASGSFDTSADFGLGHFLKAFKYDPLSPPNDNPAAYVQFSIKTAHRGNSAADYTNFKFDAHDLGQYDQIWLFGVASFGPDLTDSELKKLSQFMNEGGGVFATGDHEDLGVKMCGRVPRVRCMRRWWFNTSDPLGSPKAPPASTFGGANNHNTIVDNPATPGTNEEGIFQYQSDNYPQRIRPRYRRVFYGNALRRRVFPHPLLCGPNGVIKVLPDHMHEGRCDIYQDFGRTQTFDGYSFPEFPNATGTSTRLEPEVIADNENQVDSTFFESISAYDGHKTPTNGRIVCDATWHHFFNVNLEGFETSRSRVRAGTANADDVRSENDYVNIRAYFRNIACWLSRRNDQECMRRKGYHLVAHDVDFQIAWKPLEFVKDRLSYFYFLGEVAKNSLNQYAPQCQWYEWLIWNVKDLPVFKRLFPKHPGDPLQEKEQPFLRFVDLDTISTTLLGESMHRLYEFSQEQKKVSEDTYARFDKIILEGRDSLLNEIFDSYNRELNLVRSELGGNNIKSLGE
jgi:hypothetical protein